MADIVVRVDLGEGGGAIPVTFSKIGTIIGDTVNSSVKITNKSMRRFVIRTARVKAPFWSGNLRRSIKLGNNRDSGDNSNYQINVDAPYAAAQEFGYTPHFVPWNTPTKIPTGPYGFIWNYMEDKGILGSGITVIRNTPFMRPSLLRASSVFGKRYAPEAKKMIIKKLGRRLS